MGRGWRAGKGVGARGVGGWGGALRGGVLEEYCIHTYTYMLIPDIANSQIPFHHFSTIPAANSSTIRPAVD